MKLPKLFRPKATISEDEINRGLRLMALEGMASLGFFSITTSGFLAAFALALGANNLQIGILASIPFITQPLQIPAIILVERIRRRKLVAIAAWVPAQMLWIPIALIPYYLDVPSPGAISMLLGLLALRGIFNAVNSCAWNSWLRDLIPQRLLGNVVSRRLSLAVLAGMIFGLAAAFFADWWKGQATIDSEIYGYTIPLLFGIFTLALMSPIFMAFMPEPLMQPSPEPKPSLASTIAAPFRDKNYRKLLRFLFLWGIAINLATPFFAVYMLQRLGLPLSAVIGFSILSQLFNFMFLRIWGGFTDQFGTKAVFSVSVSLYLFVILLWTFTTMPDRYFMTIPLLILIHILAGIAASGVTLSTGTIGMKMAPAGAGTAYLAGAGLATNLGAGIGPLLGGRFADYFSVRQLSLTFEWSSPNHQFDIGALNLTGFDFLFGISFLLGLVTLALLGGVKEKGEVSKDVLLDTLQAPMRQMSRPLSTIAGLSFLSQFPNGQIRRVPVPGLDVALGVTAFQIAEIARLATVAARRGRMTTGKLARSLEEGLTGIFPMTDERLKNHGLEVAKETARGAIHSIDKISRYDLGQLARQAMLGVTGALRRSKIDSRDSIRGASYGVVQGASEVQGDISEAALQAIKAARDIAVEVGLPEDIAVAEAAQGVLESAEALGPEVLARVKAALSAEFPADTSTIRDKDEDYDIKTI